MTIVVSAYRTSVVTTNNKNFIVRIINRTCTETDREDVTSFLDDDRCH